MKKPLVVTLLTGVVLTFGAPAIGAPPNVSINGAGVILDNASDGTVHITVSARRAADAHIEDGRGNVTIKFAGEPAVHGTVSCLEVFDGEASLAGELNNGLSYSIYIQDGEHEGVPDKAELIEVGPDVIFNCKLRGTDHDVIKGDFRVRD